AFHDPYVETCQVGGRLLIREPDLAKAVRSADLTILLTDHRVYTSDLLTDNAPFLLDTRGRTSRTSTTNAELL
ncbi:nucleotide sugar dehydrogenase, partial [Kibdelosporangium lantanae]